MTLRLTPQNIEDAYNYLKNTAPFNKWKLPDADGVEFRVTDQAKIYGQYVHVETDKKLRKHRIDISNAHTKSTHKLIETVAHEMTHMHQLQSEYSRPGRKSAHHGTTFKRYAKRVCAAHGFDLKTF